MEEIQSPITIPYTQTLVNKVIHKLRPMTTNMHEPNEEIINEEQDKLRKYFGTKYQPDCFAIAMMIIEDLNNKTSWIDFFPQKNQFSQLTQRIYNTYESNHDVRLTHKLRCICGHLISADNSYFYHNPSVSPVYLIVGMDCAEKHQLASHDDILKLRKQKRDIRKEKEKKLKLEQEKENKFKCLINKFKLYYTQFKKQIIKQILFTHVHCQLCNIKCSKTNKYHICLSCKLIFDKNN